MVKNGPLNPPPPPPVRSLYADFCIQYCRVGPSGPKDWKEGGSGFPVDCNHLFCMPSFGRRKQKVVGNSCKISPAVLLQDRIWWQFLHTAILQLGGSCFARSSGSMQCQLSFFTQFWAGTIGRYLVLISTGPIFTIFLGNDRKACPSRDFREYCAFSYFTET